jgi:phosphoribosylanthranilate isomerase
MTLVKICGITNLEDALVSIEAGADALGFNFYKHSPRYIAPTKVLEIIKQLPDSVLKVGIFVNEDSPKDVTQIAGDARLDAVQLHGEEPPSYCHELKSYHVIKALRVSDDFKPEDVLKFNVEAILLDTYSRKAHGGTGKAFDWAIAKETQKIFPKLFLAGGLTPDNVAEAIKQVRPFAVDVCSSLEIIHGKKDATKVEAFVQAVRDVKG